MTNFVDLSIIRPKALEARIKSLCKGRVSLLDLFKMKGKGIAGFTYIEGIPEVDALMEKHSIKEEPYKANLELFKGGLGLYLQRRRDYFLILLPFDILNKICVIKDNKAVELGKFSTGITQYDFAVQIYTEIYPKINLAIRLTNEKKVNTFFEKSPLKLFMQ